MRSRKLPQDLRVQVAEYYEHRFRRKFFNEECILAELSKGLKEVHHANQILWLPMYMVYIELCI